MRNGNIDTASNLIRVNYQVVSTLPIRNGNKKLNNREKMIIHRNYLTYKEYNPTDILIYLLVLPYL